jgi:hypothetical protein
VQVDLGEDCWAPMRALEAALEFADEDLSEPLLDDGGRAERGRPPERDVAVERVGALWNVTAAAQARIDALAVAEGAEAALDIAA